MSDETKSQSDSLLLKAWIDHHDRDAIGQLISRNINFVYAVAYRQVRGDSHLAEDVTQAVFILLLQKAHRIQSEAAMASWLFTTTRYAAANAMKMLRRRKHYEYQAASTARTEVTDATSIDDENLQPVLNDAINSLPKSDRACVIMSYLQQKTHRQIAMSIGISEEAARKRVSRTVDRMREFLTSRGVIASITVVGASLAKQSAVSAQFIESTVNVATLSHAAIQTGSATTIAKGVSKMFFAMKVKAAAAMGVVLFGGLVTAQVVQHALTRTAAVVMTGQVQDAPKQDASSVSFPDGVKVKFVGLARWEGTSWWGIDGKPIPSPNVDRPRFQSNPPLTHQVLIHIDAPDDAMDDISIQPTTSSNSMWVKNPAGGRDDIFAFSVPEGAETIDLGVRIADGPWKTALTNQVGRGTGVAGMGAGDIEVTFTPLLERNGKTVVYVTAGHLDMPWRLSCKDINGLDYPAEGGGGAGVTDFMTKEFRFVLAPVTITSLELQIRAYTKHVSAKNITLDPAKAHQPEISIQNIP